MLFFKTKTTIKEVVMSYFLKSFLVIVFLFVVGALQRRFSSETMVNGFMDYEKGEELAPTIFKKRKKTK